MKCGGSGRLVLACAVSIALLLGMTACGGGTVGYLWVLAGRSAANTAGDVITGYKIDNYTGNLTEIVNSPFVTGSGETPVYGVVLGGGRYLYVLNQGDGKSSVVQYSVGGEGVLTPVPNAYGSTGGTPAWMDQGGGFLYVLDTVSPARNAQGIAPACVSLTNPANTAPCGSVEVFSIATDGTGLLTPVTNTAIRGANNVGISYFPTGPAPTRMKYVGGTLLVVNGDGTVTSYQAGGNGQLTASANSTQVLDASATSRITSITSGGSYVYLTDGANNRIFQYTLSSGVLQPVNGSPYSNLAPNTTPVWTLTTGSLPNEFLYVLNSGSTSTLSSTGSISIYQVNSNGRLASVAAGGGNAVNPAPTGAFPVCLVEDPSSKYIYSSNGDGTVTGYELVSSLGLLNQLRRGSQFTVAGQPTCLVASGVLS